MLVNLLTEVHDEIMYAVIDDEELIADNSIAIKLDYLLNSLKDTRLEGEVESNVESEAFGDEQGVAEWRGVCLRQWPWRASVS